MKKILRFSILFTLILSLAQLAAVQALGEWQPRLSVAEEVYRFEPVKEGAVVKQTVLIENTGREDLRIESVTPSCDCVHYKLSSRTIAPEKKAELSVSIDTKGKSGEYVGSVFISSNDPVEPVKRIKFYVPVTPDR
jgi:uncharacterized protein (DUF58 family)